jgi:hypothetical protein
MNFKRKKKSTKINFKRKKKKSKSISKERKKKISLLIWWKYDNGSDTWPGIRNVTSEFYLTYHRTHKNYVNDITKAPLKNGSNISYGKGIYCSPKEEIALQFCISECEIDIINGKKKFQYGFICKVNCSKIY